MTWVPPSSGGGGEQPAGGEPPSYGSPSHGTPPYSAPPSAGTPSYGVPGSGSPGAFGSGYGGRPGAVSGPGGPAQGVGPGGGGQGKPPTKRSEREARAERALRALPPPPNPPAGMGAVAVFTPPVPRPNRTVLIVSLVLGATLLLCCGGGVFGIGGLAYVSYTNEKERAQDVVQSYLGDLQGGRFPQAYDRLCTEARAERSVDEFAADERTAGQVAGFSVSDKVQTDEGGNWVLSARVSRQGNAARTELFPIVFEGDSGAQVCPG